MSSDTSRPNPNAKDVFVQVHVSFISRQTQIIIGEKVLRDIFSPYGVIADVTVKKHTLNMVSLVTSFDRFQTYLFLLISP